MMHSLQVDLSWDISLLFHITMFLCLLNSVGKKYFKFLGIISYVPKYKFTIRPIKFMKAVNFQLFSRKFATFTDSTAATNSR